MRHAQWLRHIVDLYRKTGLETSGCARAEFYLVSQNTDPDMPLKPPVGRSGAQKPRVSITVLMP